MSRPETSVRKQAWHASAAALGELYGEKPYEFANRGRVTADAAMRVLLTELRDEYKEQADFHRRCPNMERAIAYLDAAERVESLLKELG